MPRLLLLPATAWLTLFVAAPCLILLAIALGHPVEAVPPVTPALDPSALIAVFTDPLYRQGLLGSLVTAFLAASLCLLIGYPMALGLTRAPHLLPCVVLPLWSGFLLRLMAWIGLLRDEGWINAALRALGLIDAPLPMLHSDGAMLLGIVYTYLPFLVLPLYARLAAADPALPLAAADLGASPIQIFRRITLPLSLPGVLAGFLLVFIPATGEYVIPALLGAPDSLTIGRVIWDTFFQENDWPQAAALAVVLLGGLSGVSLLLRK